MTNRLIGVFTGNRAEYGLQVPLLRAIERHPTLDYCLFVSGAHLADEFGSTLSEIEDDGFNIHAEIKIDITGSDKASVARAIGSGILSMTRALEELQPDLLAVYGDRFEGFAAIIAASQMGIPVAHIEGGDLTAGGALDDSVRHAMTKLSHIHFTTNRQAYNRVLALGEENWRVHNVGFPANDLIFAENFATKKELLKLMKLDLGRPIILFTQHSVTTEYHESKQQVRPSLAALKRLAVEGAQVIITYPNNDLGGIDIVHELLKLQNENISNIKIHKSLGRYIYHGLLNLSKDPKVKLICAGNSSSGIKETPIFGCPSINIGSRQAGRLRGSNVIDVMYDEESIYQAIRRCIDSEKYTEACRSANNPYRSGNAGDAMVRILSQVELDKKLIQKAMTLRGDNDGEWYR